MAVWYIANNLWSSSEEPVDLGLVDGVQAYRVQSLMGAYNNCVAGDTLTLDPDSPNFKDNRGYRLKTVIFEMEANWTVAKSITLSGGVYRLRLDGGGARNARLTDVTFKDVDFCRLYDPTTDCIVVHNVCRFERCQFIGCDGAWSTIDFNSDSSSVLADCAFYGNKTNIRSNVPSETPRKIIFERCILYCSYSSTFVSYIDSINLYGLTQEQVNVIGFIKPPKAGVHLDTDETSPTYNKYIYEDGTPWTKDDWKNVDLRLKPDSPYATGNSLTTADGEVLDLDGVPRKPGGAKGAYEVAKSVIYFGTDGWDGTGALSWLGVTKTLWGEYPTYLCNTVDQAISVAPYDGIVTPDPDSASFRDAAGFRLHTVTVPLGASLAISKSITLAGGAYRLRLDGGGNYRLFSADSLSSGVVTFVDVDFVNMTSLSYYFEVYKRHGIVFNRCLFANMVCNSTYFEGRWGAVSSFLATNCAFIGVRTKLGTFNSTNQTYNRCSLYVNADPNLNILGTDNIIDSSGESFVKSKGAAADVTDWSDWESTVDLRLNSDSSYATGNALTSADGEVYDLAGNKRKIGGAKGAYEVLDDVTHWSRVFIRGWKYTVEYESDDAPVIVSIGKSQNRTSTRERTLFSFRDYAFIRFQYLSSSNAWTTISESQTRYVNTEISITLKKFRVTNDSGAYAYITLYAPNDTAPSNAQVCNMNISLSLSFANQDDLAASSVTANSVCYVDNNTIYADSASTVKKVYISGWTHVDLGDVTTTDSLVLGLGATVETSGNLTLKNETATSETSGVVNAGGGVLTMRSGAAITIDGGSFSGVLPMKITLTNDAAVTATGSNSGVVFGADYELPSGSSLALTGGTLTATSATISGTLTLNNVDLPDDITSLTIGGSFFVKQNITVETLVLSDGAEITFEDGSFLSATTTATLGAASVDGYGYLATPHGTDRTSLTTGSEVRLSDYGAGVSDFSAVAATPTTVELTWIQSNNTATALIERLVDGVWTVVNSAATSPLTVDTNE